MKSEVYYCSEFIAKLLELGDDGMISFTDFNKRVLKENLRHSHTTLFEKVQMTDDAVYLLSTSKGTVWVRSKVCYYETDESGNTKVYGISEVEDHADNASIYKALQDSERILNNIYNNIPIGIELYDKDGYMIDLNRKDMEMFYISAKEDIIGINLFDNPLFPEEMKWKLKNHEEVDFTFRYDFSKLNGYYINHCNKGTIDLTTKATALYDDEEILTNYLLIDRKSVV